MPATETDFDFSGRAIRARREALGLTPEELALAVSASTGTVQAWEADRRRPRERVRPLIRVALGLAADDDDHVRALRAANERARAWLDLTDEQVAELDARLIESCAESGVPVAPEDPALIDTFARQIIEHANPRGRP
jgi:transcriptional regulator with XRE-family HTH domain